MKLAVLLGLTYPCAIYLLLQPGPIRWSAGWKALLGSVVRFGLALILHRIDLQKSKRAGQRTRPAEVEREPAGPSRAPRARRQIVVYIATTTRDPGRWHRFADAVRRQVPGGAEMMNKTEQMIEIYGEVREQEGRQEGELRGKVLTIEGFLGGDVPWSTIEAATGIDEAAFRRLKLQIEAADDGTNHPN